MSPAKRIAEKAKLEKDINDVIIQRLVEQVTHATRENIQDLREKLAERAEQLSGSTPKLKPSEKIEAQRHLDKIAGLYIELANKACTSLESTVAHCNTALNIFENDIFKGLGDHYKNHPTIQNSYFETKISKLHAEARQSNGNLGDIQLKSVGLHQEWHKATRSACTTAEQLNSARCSQAMTQKDAILKAPVIARSILADHHQQQAQEAHAIAGITNPHMMNPGMMNPGMMNPAMMNPAMMNPAMMNPAMMNPAMMNPAMKNPAMMNPAMMNPAMMNPAMMNPAMMNPAMMNPAMMGGSGAYGGMYPGMMSGMGSMYPGMMYR